MVGLDYKLFERVGGDETCDEARVYCIFKEVKAWYS